MKEKKYILALDQGTTSTRAILYGRGGEALGEARREIRQHYPQPGWVEHDPMEIWEGALWVMKEVLAEKGASPEDVAGIAITNQRETTVAFDRKGQPLHRAIVWQCRRTAEACRKLEEAGHGPLFREATGLPLDPYFSGTKMAWLLEHVPGLREMGERGEALFGTIDTWLLYRLTEGRNFATDHTNASRTLLFNISSLEWDQRLLDILGIPGAMLPEARPSDGPFGMTELLGAPIPVAAMVGDQQGALFGQGCLSPGEAKNTYGTGCFLLANTGEERLQSKAGLLTTIGISRKGQLAYALEGSVFVGGALLKWLRDELGLFRENGEIEALAREAGSSGGVVIVPAFSGLGAPYWMPEARGAIFGLTGGSSRGAILRAALEAIAFQVRDLLEAIREDGVDLKSLKVDGGGSVNRLLLEIQAGLSGMPVIPGADPESTARGAFYLAGLALGFWKSEEALFSGRAGDTEAVLPAMEPLEREDLLSAWKNSVAAAGNWRGK